MTRSNRIVFGGLGIAWAVCLVGCGSDVGVHVDPVKSGAAYVTGTPQERIQRITNDASMPEAEKQRRIAYIKQKFNIK
ncbi:MAG TPA: hypothetical protein VG944_07910 [Fimbriimonas sp.]|nr:hypothetical protein [Fimbriimonas sp.]